MATGKQKYRQSRTFPLTDPQWDLVNERVQKHGYNDGETRSPRSAYLMALIEAEITLGFTAVLDSHGKKILRPDPAAIGSERVTLVPSQNTQSSLVVIPDPVRSALGAHPRRRRKAARG